MELLQLKYFCDAAETQNFSKTAQKYTVPPSNISQTIHRLEKELGTELFEHKSNRVILNEYGKIFYKGAKSALDALDNTMLSVHDLKGAVSGEIRIIAATNRRLVTEAIEKFKKTYPAVSFWIGHDNSKCDEVDFIISDKEPPGINYEKTLLLREDIVLAVDKSSTLADKQIIDIKSLKNCRFITMHNGSSLYEITNKLCIDAGFAANIAIQSNDPYYIRKYIELGLGIAFIPSLSWKGQLSDNVICKSIGNIKRNTYIFRNETKYMTKASKSFAELIIETAENY